MSDVVDWKEQGDCYNVLFDYFRRNNLLEAMNIWAAGFIYADENLLPWNGSWDNRLQYPDRLLDWLYGKPAEKVIGANWKP